MSGGPGDDPVPSVEDQLSSFLPSFAVAELDMAPLSSRMLLLCTLICTMRVMLVSDGFGEAAVESFLIDFARICSATPLRAAA